MLSPSAIFVSEIEFFGRQRITFSENEKTIIVGPNNSGKSQILRDIFEFSKNPDKPNTICISDLAISKPEDKDFLSHFLRERATFVNNSYFIGSSTLQEFQISLWNASHLRGNICDIFFKNIDAENRLKICQQAPSKRNDQPKDNPQQILYDSRVLTEKVSSLFRKAFNKGLLIDYRGGSVIPLHVGDEPNWEHIDRVSDEYVEYVRSNPRLDRQGDGIKSYAGILLETVINDYSMVAIDEPEAFLHPPQMRRLGETLATEVKGQLFVATHSSDILRGFLEGAKGNVRILRISRGGEQSLISEPTKEAISELWEKPNLRYSNALDGIFHEQTILCEDDSDCRLINSIADHLALSDDALRIDTAYVPTGGKAAIPKTASVLRKIGVPVKAVFDLDFLSDKDLVMSTFTAFGGTWSHIEKHWSRVDSAVRNGNKPKSPKEIKDCIAEILNRSDQDTIPKSEILSAMKQNSPWFSVKNFGENGLPKGEIRKEYDQLQQKLEEVGIYLVPVGEVENFYPSIGGHGPKFVTSLLSSVPLGSSCLADLQKFVRKVCMGPAAAPPCAGEMDPGSSPG